MCGIIGCVVKNELDKCVIKDSLALINHRGPDNSRYEVFRDSNTYTYLGHARLSIIDLRESSDQPFHSKCGRFVLTYNGEIYNYKELRAELEDLGHIFQTESDTEVLLYSYIEWGEGCFEKLIGMFAFALLDRQSSRLTIARDAFGIKPLYYAKKNGEIFFSSEIRPLIFLMGDRPQPNLQRAYDYLVHGDYDSNDESFIEGILHLPAANYLTFDLTNLATARPQRWWNPNLEAESSLTFEQAVEHFRNLFLESIKLHLRSDVPIGIALSGGVDSSSIVSAVRYLNPTIEINTYSYIASDQKISEENWIDSLNMEVNAVSHKVHAENGELLNDLDKLIIMQGEPFGSTSIYAQYRVFKLASQHGLKVTLDGQGADELAAGYDGYPGQRFLSIIETSGWIAALKYSKKWASFPGRRLLRGWMWFARIKLPDFLYSFFRKKMGRDFKPRWLNIKYLKRHNVVMMENRPKLESNYKGRRVHEALARSLTARGLQELLRHGDRNSMAWSVESRVPFLTIRIAEFLLSLPENYLISNEGITKHILREAMRGIVPDHHLDRKDKIGFQTPQKTWINDLSSEFRRWIEEAPELEFVNKKEISFELDRMLENKKSYDSRIWNWLNYLRWATLIGIK
jgi:asparagine synthase (glutamine-hydrolysing)